MSLAGKKGLIVGIANNKSIATGCAQVLRAAGAELAITYLNDKAKAYVEPVAQAVEAPIFEPLDVTKPEQMEALFTKIKAQWGELDFLIHSIAFCPMGDLHGRVVDCSAEGFSQALDISCHSLARLTKQAEPLMTQGGCVLTMSYLGAEKVVPDYNIMGVAKAALEATVRYMAAELAPQNIRVNAISPGPIATRAASGIHNFDILTQRTIEKAPNHQLANAEDVGELTRFLVSDAAKALTGSVFHVDHGTHMMF